MSQSEAVPGVVSGMKVTRGDTPSGVRTLVRGATGWAALDNTGRDRISGPAEVREAFIRESLSDGFYQVVSYPANDEQASTGEAQKRKTFPLATGCVDYFPDALLAVAELSRIGNEQHNPGKPLHWDRAKSTDEADALLRHFVDRGKLDTDGVRHSAKVAWRALALLQKEIEKDREGTGGGEHF